MNPTPLAEASVSPSLGDDAAHDKVAPRHAPIVLDDVRSDVQTEAAKEREEAIHAVYEWQRWTVDAKHPEGFWETYVLEPYSVSREGLFHRLCESSVPLPAASELRNLDAFVPHAIILLFLCSHQPEQFRHLRPDSGRFHEAIEAWGDVNVPRSRAIEAAGLALKIHNAANKPLAIATGSGKDSGNGQRPI